MTLGPAAQPRLAALALAAMAIAGCARGGARAEGPPPESLAQVPDGFGKPYGGGAHLTVKDRLLVLPGGAVCGAARIAATEPGAAFAPGAPRTECDRGAVEKLRHERIVFEVDRGTAMGELSQALANLREILGEDDYACLLVRDARERRCIPFRPFAAEDFSAWIDAPRPLGKIRVIFRADGMEVVADRGKVPGPDRYGPSLPPIEGKPDFEGLERILRLIAAKFPDEDQAALAPSAGIRVEHVARALAALSGQGAGRFGKTMLVYP